MTPDPSDCLHHEAMLQKGKINCNNLQRIEEKVNVGLAQALVEANKKVDRRNLIVWVSIASVVVAGITAGAFGILYEQNIHTLTEVKSNSETMHSLSKDLSVLISKFNIWTKNAPPDHKHSPTGDVVHAP